MKKYLCLKNCISSNHNHNFQMQCNCNRSQFSNYFHNYTNCLIIYHTLSCQRYGFVCKAKYNNRTDLPLTSCCHIYIGFMNKKENVLKHCFRCCCYYKSKKQAFHINLCCFHTVKPKLVSCPAIVHGFLLTPSF